MSAATATAAAPAAVADARIPLRGHLRHTGALIRRNLLWIKQDPESMFDALLMPVVFTLLFVYVFGGSIGQALGGGQDGYVQYVIPGMIAMMSMTLSQGSAPASARTSTPVSWTASGPCRSGAARCCSRRSRWSWCGCCSRPPC